MSGLYTFERNEVERVKKLENKNRQSAFKERMAAEGMVQVHGWVHRHQQADMIVLAHMLRANPQMEVGPVRHSLTGRLHKLR